MTRMLDVRVVARRGGREQQCIQRGVRSAQQRTERMVDLKGFTYNKGSSVVGGKDLLKRKERKEKKEVCR